MLSPPCMHRVCMFCVSVFSSGYISVLPQFKDIYCRQIGISKLSIECKWLWEYVLLCPVMGWHLVWGIPCLVPRVA